MAETDDRYAYSRLTDTWYRVFDYDHVEGDKIIANSKEEVAREDVPQEWLERIDERPLQAETDSQ
ncbi:hypothetical protein [Natrinema versiforme]|uniref:Uncharacterized protein n=1 Tax=Natrinema versiforme JCM 10478 TaxID=1227496 RepID=L9Y5F3_9EURY|nr:hypothetical protein [Natrinema versiforme]ELY68886.1 hypothetical protein C489_05953 [Natrinema versiforme JCM 10478]